MDKFDVVATLAILSTLMAALDRPFTMFWTLLAVAMLLFMVAMELTEEDDE